MRDPNALVSTEQLAAMLGQPNVRVYDCTTYLDPAPAGSNEPYIARPGRESFEKAHIPGADFLDLQGEFSDQGTKLRFMMPPVAQLEAAFGRHGIGDGIRPVLYSIGTPMWATRFWWMLRSLGFDDAAVLDGGLDYWQAQGRPVESGPSQGLSGGNVQGQAPARPVRRQIDGEGRDRQGRYGDGQRARAAVPQGRRAQPLWPARPRAQQRQCFGGDAARSRHQDGSRRWPTPRPN